MTGLITLRRIMSTQTKHAAVFLPDGNTRLLLATDGGVFKTTDGGTHWTDLSNGLMICASISHCTTPQNVKLITSGWQDNGL
jgi:photosystem II stability/assembly factor-like uncharacterized protein